DHTLLMDTKEYCETCGARRRIERWPDGSTWRHVQRPRMQPLIRAVWDAYELDDGFMAIEAMEELANNAEQAWVESHLSSAQQKWLQLQRYVSRDDISTN
ncbi:unnamed protein product, partial [marine sediment metagenome]